MLISWATQALNNSCAWDTAYKPEDSAPESISPLMQTAQFLEILKTMLQPIPKPSIPSTTHFYGV